jgi:hypothetical protein
MLEEGAKLKKLKITKLKGDTNIILERQKYDFEGKNL